MEREQASGASAALQDTLNRLIVGEGRSYGAMTLFPVFAPEGQESEPLSYQTLDEAIAAGSVEVMEQASATVPELVLVNKGSAMVLVLDGQEIVGGRQNRIVNASFLVAGGSRVVLPVTCVEHGRWRETSSRFASGEVSFFNLKRNKSAQILARLKETGHHVADQNAIWEEIAYRATAARSHSPTGAMYDLFAARDTNLGDYQRAFPYVENAVGMIVALGGRMAGADVFDQGRTAAKVWDNVKRPPLFSEGACQSALYEAIPPRKRFTQTYAK